ncbi:MAG: hypothetical protein ACOZF2_05975 [Thermodesulfobacteriota bacterium]
MKENQPGCLKGHPGLLVSTRLKKPQIMEGKMNTIAAHPENRGKFYLKTILSYFLILALCGLYLLFCSPLKGFCHIYYVDATNGNDGNDGQAPSNAGTPPTHGPWQTLKKVSIHADATNPDHFGPGDKILLKRGQTWNLTEQDRVLVNGVNNTALAIRCGGTSTNGVVSYITFGDYGPMTAAKPKINGDNIAVNRSDCVVYINNDFIRLKNINITYNACGFDHGGNVGKGIRIDANYTNPDQTNTECNIWIDSCDVSNCPENGITIGPDRHYVVIDGFNNFPTLNNISPIISLLLMFDDSTGESNLASSASSSTTAASSDLSSDNVLIPPPMPNSRHIPRPHHIYRPPPPPPPLPDEAVLEWLRTQNLNASVPDAFIPPPPTTPSRPPVVPTIYPPMPFSPPDEIFLAQEQNLNSASQAVEGFPIPPPPDISATTSNIPTMDEGGGSGDDPNSGYYSHIYGNGQSGICVFFNPSDYDPNYNPIHPSDYINVNNCAIYNNNNHGIYFAGDYAVIENNKIYANGRSRDYLYQQYGTYPYDQNGYPLYVYDHNIYLIGDHALVNNNELLSANNGNGFRFAGSFLNFSNNKVEDNAHHGIGFSIDSITNDPHNVWPWDKNGDRNEIKNNNYIKVIHYDKDYLADPNPPFPWGHGVGDSYNKAISIGSGSYNFTHTNIGTIDTDRNTLDCTGSEDIFHQNHPDITNRAGGIELSADRCIGTDIASNIFKNISGYQISIYGDGSDPAYLTNPNMIKTSSPNTYDNPNPSSLIWFWDDYRGDLNLDAWHNLGLN